MAIVLANSYKAALLNLKRRTLRDSSLHLFRNDVTPNGTTTVGPGPTQIQECTFTGYASQPLAAIWGPAYQNAAGQGEMDGLVVTFTLTGLAVLNPIYGYYVLDRAGNLIYSDRNAAGPVMMMKIGQEYTVAPIFLEDTL